MPRSKRVHLRPGQMAAAPKVDRPRGFAIENFSGRPLTVSFRYDAERHIQTVVVEEPRPAHRTTGEFQHYAGEPL